MAKISIPVFFKPLTHSDGTVHIQIFRDLSYKVNVSATDKECQVMGELKTEYPEIPGDTEEEGMVLYFRTWWKK